MAKRTIFERLTTRCRRRWIVLVTAVIAGALASSALAGASGPTARNGRLAYTAIVSALQTYAVRPEAAAPDRLIVSLSVDYEPVASPDGRRIAFASSRDGNDEIYVANANGTNVTRLTRHRAPDYDPAWSPDSRSIAFSSERDGNSEIYAVAADGSRLTRLTGSAGDDENPAWSPDGTRIAFWSDRDDDADIYVMNADGTSTVALTANDDGDYFPAWSPDGARIAFTSDRDRQGDDEIFAMNADGTGAVQLTTTAGAVDDWWPSWSPDGARIAFTSDRGDDDEILVMNADGRNQLPLTDNEEVDDFGPSWARDGRILFTSEQAANLGVETAELDGSKRRLVALSPGLETSSAWSPDGTRIALTSDRGGKRGIYVAAATGRGVRRLTNDKLFDDDDAAWSPDGRRLAFVRRDEFGTAFLYTIGVDGSGLRFLLEGSMCCPDWSPDGRRIALSFEGDIVVVNADGSGRRLVSGGGFNTSPSWSPDGTRLAFDSDRGDDWDIFVVPARGGPATVLTRNDEDDEWPEWSPDGRLIAFSRGDLDDLEASLYVMNVDGGRERRVDLHAPSAMPSWQPIP